MEYKVEINSLENFKAWSGGLETLNTVRERGGVDTLTIEVNAGNYETILKILKKSFIENARSIN